MTIANEILPWSQIGAKFRLGARTKKLEPDDFPWSQISRIWLRWSQLGSPEPEPLTMKDGHEDSAVPMEAT